MSTGKAREAKTINATFGSTWGYVHTTSNIRIQNSTLGLFAAAPGGDTSGFALVVKDAFAGKKQIIGAMAPSGGRGRYFIASEQQLLRRREFWSEHITFISRQTRALSMYNKWYNIVMRNKNGLSLVSPKANDVEYPQTNGTERLPISAAS